MNERIALLLHVLDEGYSAHAWHGTTLLGSLRGLSEQEVCARPSHERHNIWEVMLHAAYWKYTVRRRILGEKRGSFPLKGSNWFLRPDPGREMRWKDEIALLKTQHRLLRETVAGLDVKELDKVVEGTRYTATKLVVGVAAHDLYHAGQIQLLKRLVRSGAEAGSSPRRGPR